MNAAAEGRTTEPVMRVFDPYEYGFAAEVGYGRVVLSRRLLSPAAVGPVEAVGCVEGFEEATARVRLDAHAVGHPIDFLLQVQAIARDAWEAATAPAPIDAGVRR